jgi:hypothetical protein
MATLDFLMNGIGFQRLEATRFMQVWKRASDGRVLATRKSEQISSHLIATQFAAVRRALQRMDGTHLS